MKPILVLSTVDSADLGRKISIDLVETGLAACVNVVPGIRSIYRWKGKVCDEAELLLIVKTTLEAFEEVRERIRSFTPTKYPKFWPSPSLQEILTTWPGWTSRSGRGDRSGPTEVPLHPGSAPQPH